MIERRSDGTGAAHHGARVCEPDSPFNAAKRLIAKRLRERYAHAPGATLYVSDVVRILLDMEVDG